MPILNRRFAKYKPLRALCSAAFAPRVDSSQVVDCSDVECQPEALYAPNPETLELLVAHAGSHSALRRR